MYFWEPEVNTLLTQSINLFATGLLVLAFAMIAQRRILTLIHLFTLQGASLVAAVAAKNKPFSIDRKPMTWGTALARTIIIRKDNNTLASAIPSVPRAIEADRPAIGVARLKAKITSTMPASSVVGMLISVSTSQRTFSRSITRCRSHGIRNTLSASVSPADRYRCGWRVA